MFQVEVNNYEKEGMKMNMMMRLFKEEEGQGMAEYALILALIAVIVIVTLGPRGETIRDKFTEITDGLNPAAE